MGLAALVTCLTCGSLADAVELTVQIRTPAGAPVRGAVVMLHGPAGTPAAKSTSVVVDQVDKAFSPDLVVMPVGSTVTFPNSDNVSHQVYSFSPAKRFQLPLYRGTPYPPTTFENAGIVTLGCNIHDDMIAYLVVTDARWFGRTGPDGSWSADGLPAGQFRVEVWHPRLREKSPVVELPLSLTAVSPNKLEVKLTRPLRPEALGRKPRSWGDY